MGSLSNILRSIPQDGQVPGARGTGSLQNGHLNFVSSLNFIPHLGQAGSIPYTFVSHEGQLRNAFVTLPMLHRTYSVTITGKLMPFHWLALIAVFFGLEHILTFSPGYQN